jgi:hypothetical protein
MSWNELYELLKASGEQDAAAASLPPTEPKCRVYHDGIRIVQVLLGPEWPDLGMPWIETSPENFGHINNLTHRIVENQIVSVDFSPQRIVQLTKSESGPYRSVQGLSTVLLEDNENYEFVQYYDNRHSRS